MSRELPPINNGSIGDVPAGGGLPPTGDDGIEATTAGGDLSQRVDRRTTTRRLLGGGALILVSAVLVFGPFGGSDNPGKPAPVATASNNDPRPESVTVPVGTEPGKFIHFDGYNLDKKEQTEVRPLSPEEAEILNEEVIGEFVGLLAHLNTLSAEGKYDKNNHPVVRKLENPENGDVSILTIGKSYAVDQRSTGVTVSVNKYPHDSSWLGGSPEIGMTISLGVGGEFGTPESLASLISLLESGEVTVTVDRVSYLNAEGLRVGGTGTTVLAGFDFSDGKLEVTTRGIGVDEVSPTGVIEALK